MKLTAKQEKFAQNIVDGMTQKDSYTDAYDAENMTDKQVYEEASKLAAHPKISQRVEQLRKPALEILAEAQADFAKSIKEAATIAVKEGKDGVIEDYATRYKAAKVGLDYLDYSPEQKVKHTFEQDEVEDMLKSLQDEPTTEG